MAARRTPATRRSDSRSLGGGRGREGEAGRWPSGQLADRRGRSHRHLARRRAFPPESSGRRSRRPRPASCFAGSSAAGACPSGGDSTMAIPGARLTTCPRNWRCGWWGWGSSRRGTHPANPGSTPASNASTAPPSNGSRSRPVPTTRPRKNDWPGLANSGARGIRRWPVRPDSRPIPI